MNDLKITPNGAGVLTLASGNKISCTNPSIWIDSEGNIKFTTDEGREFLSKLSETTLNGSPLPEDVEQAIDLLAQAGFKDGSYSGGGGGGSSIDYTSILNQIKAGVDAIDGDTNDLAPIKTSVANLETLITNGNATQGQIKTAIDAILSQSQDINTNTANLETILTDSATQLNNISGFVDGLEGLVDDNGVNNPSVGINADKYDKNQWSNEVIGQTYRTAKIITGNFNLYLSGFEIQNYTANTIKFGFVNGIAKKITIPPMSSWVANELEVYIFEGQFTITPIESNYIDNTDPLNPINYMYVNTDNVDGQVTYKNSTGVAMLQTQQPFIQVIQSAKAN